jgi:hypothetical protein
MTRFQILALSSAVFGALGTTLLFFFSNTDQPYQGAAWGGDETGRANQRIREQNARWRKLTKLGYALLCVSFILQMVSVFAPT